MIIRLKPNITNVDFAKIENYFKSKKLALKDISSNDVKLYGIIGDTSVLDSSDVKSLPGIVDATRVQAPYKLASRQFHQEDTVITINDTVIGGGYFTVIAGPSVIENEDKLKSIADTALASGAHFFFGGAYKARVNPYTFQGLEANGIKMLSNEGKRINLPIVSEILSIENIELFKEYVDIIMVGEQNMQNYSLLKALGKVKKPVILTRGKSATIEEWLMSAEYIMNEGNQEVILCEAGIRTFETYTNTTPDLSAVLAVKKLSHLPVIVAPSVSTGRYDMVLSLAKACLAIGADGIITDINSDPENAICDGNQALKPDKFDYMMKKLRLIAPIVDKEIV